MPPHRWEGGQLDLDPPITARLVKALSRNGTWAAQLIPEGYRDGHWVVVDGPFDGETVGVRDPAGSSYHMPLQEFGVLLRNMVVVFETGE